MKNIIFDGSDLCTKNISGVSRYAYEVIINIDELLKEQNNINIILCYPKDKEIILPEVSYIKIVPLTTNGKAFRTKVLKKYAKLHRAVICTFGPSIAYSSNMIITIHDVRSLETTVYDTKSSRRFMRLVLLSCLFNRARIVTDAEYQKEKINQLGHVPKEKINVFGCGWEHIDKVKLDNHIFDKFPEIKKGKYLYALGSVAKHKNYKWIYEVAARNKNIQFVIAGNISKKAWGIDSSSFVLDNIIFTGYVTDEENKALISSCKAFLQPSKYEGFGIPPLEAIVLGKKALVSNVTCLPEIYDGYAPMFSPDNYEVDIIELLAQKTNSPETLIEKYTWKRVAQLWLDLLNKMIG